MMSWSYFSQRDLPVASGLTLSYQLTHRRYNYIISSKGIGHYHFQNISTTYYGHHSSHKLGPGCDTYTLVRTKKQEWLEKQCETNTNKNIMKLSRKCMAGNKGRICMSSSTSAHYPSFFCKTSQEREGCLLTRWHFFISCITPDMNL